MTQNFTEPHYKDHTPRGGLKLHPMFSTDAFGRNTLELVCPELRNMDPDTAEGFIEIAKDRVKETMSAMRKASADGKIDCYLIQPKPGYKLDRITLKGDNALLLKIAEQYGVQEPMTHTHNSKRSSGSRLTEILDATPYLTTSLKRDAERDSGNSVTFYVQVRRSIAVLDDGRNVGSLVTTAVNSISSEAFGEGRGNIKVEVNNDLKAKGVVKVTCDMKNLGWIARKFSDACGSSPDDLERNARSVRDERAPQAEHAR